MPASRILGTGHYVPPNVVTNRDVMKMMETTEEFIVERTGVLRRRHVEPVLAASDLAALACRAAVEDAGLAMEQIELVIMNTITPDHADPGCAFFLQPKLGLAGIPVLDIQQQCAGLIYGLSIADHFVRAGTYRHVLVVCAEVLSKRIDGSYDGRNIAILLGDGAGAVVVGPADNGAQGIVSTILHADGRGAKCPLHRGPRQRAGSQGARSSHEDIDAGRVHFRMDGKAVFQNGVDRMSGAVFEALEANRPALDADRRARPPPGQSADARGDRPTHSACRRKRSSSTSRSTATSPRRRCRSPWTKPGSQAGSAEGSLVLLVAFGSGFVWGSALCACSGVSVAAISRSLKRWILPVAVLGSARRRRSPADTCAGRCAA